MTWENYWRKYSGPNYRLYLMIAAIFVLAVIVYFSNKGKMQIIPPIAVTTTIVTPTTTEVTTPSVGTLLIGVKDAKHRLAGGNDITGLNITITKVEVHKSTENETDESGWSTVYEGGKIVDLVKYEDSTAIIAQKDLDAGKYTQIRLYINRSRIKITNVFQQIYNKSYDVTIKNEDKPFKIIHPFTIEAGKTLTLTFDFDVDKSVTKDAEGYKLKPVLGKVGPFEDGVLEEQGKPPNSETIE
jgi:hypothetical protein